MSRNLREIHRRRSIVRLPSVFPGVLRRERRLVATMSAKTNCARRLLKFASFHCCDRRSCPSLFTSLERRRPRYGAAESAACKRRCAWRVFTSQPRSERGFCARITSTSGLYFPTVRNRCRETRVKPRLIYTRAIKRRNRVSPVSSRSRP